MTIYVLRDKDTDEYDITALIRTKKTKEEIEEAIGRAKEKYPGEYTSDDVWEELQALDPDIEIIQDFEEIYW